MSLLYLTNVNNTSVISGAVVPLIPQAKRGDVIEVVNNSIQLRRPGYYNIDITITFTAADAGDVSLAIYKNNVKAPGLSAVETITTANTEYRTVNIQGVVRVLCHDGISTLTLVNTSEDIDITITNVSATIVY